MRLIKIIIAMATLMASGKTLAGVCDVLYGNTTTGFPTALTLDPSLSNGSVIAKYTWRSGYWLTACPNYTTTHSYKGNVRYAYLGNKLYATGVPGVAFRYRITSPNFPKGWVPVTGWGPSYSIDSTTGEIEFVKTGEMQSGTMQGGRIVDATSNGYPSWAWSINSITMTVTARPCTITQSAISVPMPDVMSSKFKAPGDTSEATSFTLPLSCPDQRKFSLQFSGDPVDDTKGIYKNSSGSANASQIAFQLLYNNSPIGKTIGGFNFSGARDIPLSARYYARVASVQPGDVKSIINATIVYN